MSEKSSDLPAPAFSGKAIKVGAWASLSQCSCSGGVRHVGARPFGGGDFPVSATSLQKEAIRKKATREEAIRQGRNGLFRVLNRSGPI